MTPQPGPETTRAPERGERAPYKPSAKTRLHMARGVFNTEPNTTSPLPDQVSPTTFEAVQAKHNDLRQKDDQRRNALVQEQLQRESQRAEAIKQSLATKKGVNPDQISEAEIVYHASMEGWAEAERKQLETIRTSATAEQKATVDSALTKLGLLKDDQIVPAFYDSSAREGGAFYDFITTDNVYAKLAEKLSIEEINALKPFLKDILGDTLRERRQGATTDVAFNTLLAVKQTQADLATPAAKAALQQAAANSTRFPQEDTEVVKFCQEGQRLAHPDTADTQDAPQNTQNTRDTAASSQSAAQPDSAAPGKPKETQTTAATPTNSALAEPSSSTHPDTTLPRQGETRLPSEQLTPEQTVANMQKIIKQLAAIKYIRENPDNDILGRGVNLSDPVVSQIRAFVGETNRLLQQNQELQDLHQMIQGQLDPRGEFAASIFGGSGIVPNEEITTPRVVRRANGQVQIQVPPPLLELYDANKSIDSVLLYLDKYEKTIASGGTGLSVANFVKSLKAVLPAYIQLQPNHIRTRLEQTLQAQEETQLPTFSRTEFENPPATEADYRHETERLLAELKQETGLEFSVDDLLNGRLSRIDPSQERRLWDPPEGRRIYDGPLPTLIRTFVQTQFGTQTVQVIEQNVESMIGTLALGYWHGNGHTIDRLQVIYGLLKNWEYMRKYPDAKEALELFSIAEGKIGGKLSPKISLDDTPKFIFDYSPQRSPGNRVLISMNFSLTTPLPDILNAMQNAQITQDQGMLLLQEGVAIENINAFRIRNKGVRE